MVDVLSSTLAMAKKRPSSGRQIHPTGERFTVDDAWKQRVRDELKARGWTQADLAEKISAVPASITLLLKPGISQSRLVKRIHKAFGWLMDDMDPVEAVARGSTRDLIERQLPDLDDSKLELVLQLVQALSGKQPADPEALDLVIRTIQLLGRDRSALEGIPRRSIHSV